jgi:hypothetical protein
MPYDQLTENRQDGTQLGQGPNDRIGFWGAVPIPQRSSSMQASVQPFGGGVLTMYQVTATPSSVAANTFAEQPITVTGLQATDFILHVDKPTTQAGLGMAGFRVSAANTLAVNYGNDTTGALTPTTETYTVFAVSGPGTSGQSLTGVSVISLVLTPSAVPANTDTVTAGVQEQIFTVPGGAGAAGTAIINAAGQVVGVQMTNNGTNYWVPPDVDFTGGVWPVEVLSGGINGTGTPINYQPAGVTTASVAGQTTNPLPTPNATYPGGYGAKGVGIIDGQGHVIGVQMVSLGVGYQVAPTTTFMAGMNIATGMVCHVTKPTSQAGLGVAQARAIKDYQIGITYVNNTTAAITPTAGETYKVFAANGFTALSNVLDYGMNVGTIAGITSFTSVESPITLSNVQATDRILGVSKPSMQAGLLVGGARVSTTGVVGVTLGNITGATITPTASEVYDLAVFRPGPVPPAYLIPIYLTPVAVAANTTAEQAFTVVGVPSTASVKAIKGSATAGLAVVGCRVSGANTVYINYENDTAGALTPPAEFYNLEVFLTPAPGVGNRVGMAVNQACNMEIDQGNDVRNQFDIMGVELGH